MKKFSCFLMSMLFAGAAFAADAGAASNAKSKQPTAQQMKMVTCGKLAKDKKGDEHKAFMKECLSKKDDEKPAPSAAKTAQQEKMKACNKDATGKKGDERKAFMKDCLSKK